MCFSSNQVFPVFIPGCFQIFTLFYFCVQHPYKSHSDHLNYRCDRKLMSLGTQRQQVAYFYSSTFVKTGTDCSSHACRWKSCAPMEVLRADGGPAQGGSWSVKSGGTKVEILCSFIFGPSRWHLYLFNHFLVLI